MTTITRRQFICTAAAAGIGSLLTALVPGDEALAQVLTPESAQSAPSPAPNAWPLGAVPRFQTLIHVWDNIGNVSNTSPIATDYSHQNGSGVLYEPCAFYSPLANLTVMWLAESYQYNASATELTIHFRSGIKWSDGTAFTAEDAAWTINLLRLVNNLNQSANIRDRVTNAEALDSLTLKLTFNASDWRFFFNVFTFRMDLGDSSAILPKHIYSTIPINDLSTFTHYDLAQAWPVTTGPYGVGELSDGNYVNYDLRATWWAVETGLVASMPEVRRFRVEKRLDEAAVIQQLVNDEIDSDGDLYMPSLLSALSLNPNLTTYSGNQNPYGNVDWWPISLFFNCQKPPFNDKRVRWAVAYALNQQAIVDTAYGGANTVTGHPFPDYPPMMGYVNGISDLLTTYNVLEFNLTKVDALMTAAGFHKDSGGYWADASDVRLNADLYGAVPLFAPFASLIALQLRSAGFDCTHLSPPSVWSDMADGTASLFLFGHGGGIIDPLDTFKLYRAANIAPIGQQSWGNIGRWSHPTFEAARDAMAALPMGDAGVAAQFRTGMEIWLDELPDCPIMQWMHHIPLNTRYWINWPSQSNPYMSPALWFYSAHQVVINLKMNLPHNTFLPAVTR